MISFGPEKWEKIDFFFKSSITTHVFDRKKASSNIA